MKINIKGISLISLIVTILIMAILATVMIPSGIDKINSAKLTTFNDNILTLKQEANGYLIQNDDYPVIIDGSGNPVVYSITGNSELIAEATKKNDQNDTFYVVDLDKLKVDNKDNGVGKTIDDYYIMAKTSGNIYYAKGNKIGNITYYTKQNKGDGVIAIVPTSAPIPYIYGGYDGLFNSPKLSAGMTPVKWDGSAWVNANSSNIGYDWYDYTKSINKWANVKLADGSLLVWIPRYTYKILNNEHTGTAGDIDIKFSNGTADDTSNGYRIHPAFYWGGWNIPASASMTKVAGGTELVGIWVGKFDTGATNGQQGTSGNTVTIKPNIVAWRNLNIGDMFDKIRAMQTSNSSIYGISSDSNVMDTHLVKNSEWGAVAYLSKYALGATQIATNQNVSYITANGDIVANKNESTTGNEYGLYDTAGGANEYVSAMLNNGNGNLVAYGNSVVSANAKYKDVFPVSGAGDVTSNYNLTNYAYGHAFYETSSGIQDDLQGWFGAYTYFLVGVSPFVERGGAYGDGTCAGPYYYSCDWGIARVSVGFRVGVVIP